MFMARLSEHLLIMPLDDIHHCYLTAVWDHFELHHDGEHLSWGNFRNPGSKLANACFTTSLASLFTGRGVLRQLGAPSGKTFEAHGLKSRRTQIMKRFVTASFNL
ncbi:hypothetical protein TNCV_1180791 [Trichonephila clavipes]|nr:hypothetical protein TNCV_1180791 [Trichonephila clavipes]